MSFHTAFEVLPWDEGRTITVVANFDDDLGNWESLVSGATATVAAGNTDATGQPVISGNPQVGETLSVDTSGISDAEGLTNAAFDYQWVSNDGTSDTDIQDATDATYTLLPDNAGKAIKVRVSFADDAGHQESVISDPTARIPGTWAGTVTVGDGPVGSDAVGYSTFVSGMGSITTPDFESNGVSYTVQAVAYNHEGLHLGLSKAFSTPFALHVDTKRFESSEASTSQGSESYIHTWSQPGLNWSEGDSVLVVFVEGKTSEAQDASTNSAATGVPTISGTLEAGQTLTASTSGISDADGLANATFSYQWVSNDGTADTDIQGAASSTYILNAADEGKTIKVRVTFTDDAGNEETLTSAATAEVADQAPVQQTPLEPRNLGALTVSSVAAGTVDLTIAWSAPADNGGSAITAYDLRHIESDVTDKADDNWTIVEDIWSSGELLYVLTGLRDSTGHDVQVRAVNANGDGPWSATSTGTTTTTQVDASAPSNLAGKWNSCSVNLTWEVPATDALTVTGYRLLRAKGSEELSILAADTGSTGTAYSDSSIESGEIYSYQVQALRSGTASPGSNVAETQGPTPTPVTVGAVPIVVASTIHDYFVLYVTQNRNAHTAVDIPVLVKLGEVGTTTLADNLEALPSDRYRVEKYLVAQPADIDGDCIDDITELADLGTKNPINPAFTVDSNDGILAIPDWETFEAMSFKGRDGDVYNDPHLIGLKYVKFYMFDMDTDSPIVFFMNTKTHGWHQGFWSGLLLEEVFPHRRGSDMRGEIVYHPNVAAPDGTFGSNRYQFQSRDAHGFYSVAYSFEILAAAMPLLENNLFYYPMPSRALPLYHAQRTQYDNSRVNILLEEDIIPDDDYIPLNEAEGYGFLRAISLDERPNPRDLVVYTSLPNDLPRVAGIITTVPQTPLSHVNLRAVQNGVPNAFIRDALNDTTIDSLLDSPVYYQVSSTGYTIRAAALEEVNAHHDASRPTQTQTPERDLSVREITALSEVNFNDWTAFGVKAANVAELGTLGFPDGTVPDGFAVPFYFYDEFMKANDFYSDIQTMMAVEGFETDFDVQEQELKKLRKKIKKGTTPSAIITALEEMHGEFPEGTSLRYRSSTNNEDLPNFNGAGLYDSKTQDPEETEEDGIDKSIKGVWASLWNFRAFSERDFHRIDHNEAAMGVLVHPNYSDELANGVAVSFDPVNGADGIYYVNTQLGEDLVTNPDALSLPEELLLAGDGTYRVLVTSSLKEAGQLLMTDAQISRLRRYLETIHDHFEELYGIEEGEQFAIDIEFKITADNVLAIKQARPWVFTDTAKEENTTEVPAAPTGLTATTVSHDRVTLTWNDPGDGSITGYQILRRDIVNQETGVFTTIADNTGTSATMYTDTSVNARTRYAYRIKAWNQAGLSELSDWVDVETPSTDRPHGLRASADADADTVTLNWNAPDDAQMVSMYRILRHRPEEGETDLLVYVEFTHSRATSYTDTAVEPGTLYVYRVQAADPFGFVGEASNPASVRVPESNSPATGAPAISGTAQVGETLTADTSGIADADELNDATFGYQWVAADADIGDATGSAYTVVDAHEGKTIKVRVSFTDDAGNAETLTSAETDAVEARPNNPATGAPTISGTAQVGETLTAGTSGVADEDGLNNASFAYQWLADDSEIAGATSSTYTLDAGDEGKAVKVRVTFTDDAGNEESLTSAATDAVEGRPNSAATGQPTVTGTIQVGETLTADASSIADEDGLTNATFSYQWLADDSDISGAMDSAYTLTDADEGKAVSVRVSFTDDAGNAEAQTSAETDAVEARPNSPATGVPAISGTAQVGETLTAQTSGIADTDGLNNATFSYQWLADDIAISGATGSTYTLIDGDEGKHVKVRVSFTDDAGNNETLTSAATEAVPAAHQQEQEATPEPTDRPHGLRVSADADADTVTLNWNAPDDAQMVSMYRILRHRPEEGETDLLVYVEFTHSRATSYTDTAVEPGTLYIYRVQAADPFGFVGEASNPASVRVPESNRLATGAPAISGTAQVGETLTADTSGIADADELNDATFGYQWVAADADIGDATGSAYTVVDAHEGKTIKVRVSFTDDAGNAETLTSAETDAVAHTHLTASFQDMPASHNGGDEFRIYILFSEEISISYKTVRDHALTVTGGDVVNASRVNRLNDLWWVNIDPHGNGAVTIALPINTDCSATGAVCTSGKKLQSHRTHRLRTGGIARLRPPVPGASHASGAWTAGLGGLHRLFGSVGPIHFTPSTALPAAPGLPARSRMPDSVRQVGISPL